MCQSCYFTLFQAWLTHGLGYFAAFIPGFAKARPSLRTRRIFYIRLSIDVFLASVTVVIEASVSIPSAPDNS
jgi:hypothetical protein